MGLLDIIPGVGKLAESIVDRVLPKQISAAAKAENVLAVQKMLEDRDATLVTAQKEIIIAELNQGDKFTKRARPWIVYTGLVAIFINHVVVPIAHRIVEYFYVGQEAAAALAAIQPITLPDMFWVTWGSVVAVYAVGRSAEKRGIRGELVAAITGNKQ
jgi:hypothetical protein